MTTTSLLDFINKVHKVQDTNKVHELRSNVTKYGFSSCGAGGMSERNRQGGGQMSYESKCIVPRGRHQRSCQLRFRLFHALFHVTDWTG